MSNHSPSHTKKGPGRRHKQGLRRSFNNDAGAADDFFDYRASRHDREAAHFLPVMRGVTQAPRNIHGRV